MVRCVILTCLPSETYSSAFFSFVSCLFSPVAHLGEQHGDLLFFALETHEFSVEGTWFLQRDSVWKEGRVSSNGSILCLPTRGSGMGARVASH